MRLHRRRVEPVAQHRGVQNERRPRRVGEDAGRELRDRRAVVHARTEDHGVRPLEPRREVVQRRGVDAAARRLGQGDDQRLRNQQPERHRERGCGGDLQLARPGTQRGHRGEQNRAGHAGAAADRQDAAARVLVVVAGMAGEGALGEQRRVDRPHPAATALSGSAVTAAAAATGATKLYRTRRGVPAANSYSVTLQLATSPARSMARICASSMPSST